MGFLVDLFSWHARATSTTSTSGGGGGGSHSWVPVQNKKKKRTRTAIMLARHHRQTIGPWWRCDSMARDDEMGVLHSSSQDDGTHSTTTIDDDDDDDDDEQEPFESFPTTVTSSPDLRAGTPTGLVKATFQPHVLEKGNAGVLQKLRDAPWEFGYHVNERNVYWNEELQSRLYNKVASEELGMSEETLDMYLTQLQCLMPDASDKMKNMSVQTLAELVKHIDYLPHRLMVLKNIFPNANACLLGIRNPNVLLHVEEGTLQSIADELHEMFPNLDVDRLVEENPSMLDIQSIKNAIAEAKQIMPSLDIQHAMGSDPQLILGFQRGSDMISGGFD